MVLDREEAVAGQSHSDTNSVIRAAVRVGLPQALHSPCDILHLRME